MVYVFFSWFMTVLLLDMMCQLFLNPRLCYQCRTFTFVCCEDCFSCYDCCHCEDDLEDLEEVREETDQFSTPLIHND